MRFDDLQEGQLGDVIWHPDMADLSLFGTKTDRLLVGQPAVLPASSSPESGFQSLLEGARDGLRRLGELDPAALGAVARRFAAACTPQELGAGSSEMRFWPEEVQTLAARRGPLIRGGAAGALPPDLWGVAVRAVDDRLGSEARGPLP